MIIPDRDAERSTSSGIDPARTRSLRMLIVDPDAVSRRAIERVVAAMGHEVEQAHDGAAALEILHREAIDVIIAEAVLPDLPGRTLMQRAWEVAGRGVPAFVFVTADERPATRIGLVRGGAEACLGKPLGDDALQAQLEGIMLRRNRRRRASLPPTTVLAGSARDVGLPELLRMLATGKQTGILEVASGTTLGRVFLRDGLLVHAELASHRGLAAVHAMLRGEGGLFRFERRPIDVTTSIDVAIDDALAGAAAAGPATAPRTAASTREDLGVVELSSPMARFRRPSQAAQVRAHRTRLARRIIAALGDPHLLGDLDLRAATAADPERLEVELWAGLSEGISTLLELASPPGHDALLAVLAGEARGLRLVIAARGGATLAIRLVPVDGSEPALGRDAPPDLIVVAPPSGDHLGVSPARMAELALLVSVALPPGLVVMGDAALRSSVGRLLDARVPDPDLLDVGAVLGEQRGQLRDILTASLRRWLA